MFVYGEASSGVSRSTLTNRPGNSSASAPTTKSYPAQVALHSITTTLSEFRRSSYLTAELELDSGLRIIIYRRQPLHYECPAFPVRDRTDQPAVDFLPFELRVAVRIGTTHPPSNSSCERTQFKGMQLWGNRGTKWLRCATRQGIWPAERTFATSPLLQRSRKSGKKANKSDKPKEVLFSGAVLSLKVAGVGDKG